MCAGGLREGKVGRRVAGEPYIFRKEDENKGTANLLQTDYILLDGILLDREGSEGAKLALMVRPIAELAHASDQRPVGAMPQCEEWCWREESIGWSERGLARSWHALDAIVKEFNRCVGERRGKDLQGW